MQKSAIDYQSPIYQQQKQKAQSQYVVTIAQSSNFPAETNLQTPTEWRRRILKSDNPYSELPASSVKKEDIWDDILASQNEDQVKRNKPQSQQLSPPEPEQQLKPKPELRNSIAASRVIQLNEQMMRLAEKRNSLRAELEFKFFSENSPERIPAISYWENDGDKYEGETKEFDGEVCYHGRGRLDFKNGDTYIGGFYKNLMHGYGVLIYRLDGAFYAGDFVSGEKNGNGEQHYGNGDVYIGQFKHGVQHGDNAQFYVENEKSTYTIPYVDGVMHGEGNVNNKITNENRPVKYVKGVLQQEKKIVEQQEETVKRANRRPEEKPQALQQIDARLEADQLLTQFRNEMYAEADFNGIEITKESLADYSLYEGPRNDQLNSGKAIYIFPNGNICAGEWLGGVQEGYGFYFDTSIGLYKGYFLQGQKHGYGVMNYNNGDVYEGQWVADKKHGPNAIYTAFRKNIRLMGRAENGKFISQKQEPLSSQKRNTQMTFY